MDSRIYLVQDRVYWKASVNRVRNLRVRLKQERKILSRVVIGYRFIV
jgi:hypothetical protein